MQRARVDRALDRHAPLTALAQVAEDEAETAKQRAQHLAGETEAFVAPSDTRALEAAMTDAQADGQIEQHLAAAQELADAERLLHAELGALEPTVPDADALRAMRPPSVATVERFAGELDQLHDRARELRDWRERLDSDRRALDEDQVVLDLSTNVPNVQDLGAARDERDEHWRRLRRRLEGDEAELASPQTFEGQVRHVDDLADRLRAEADAVARRAQLTVRERRLDRKLGDLADEQRALDAGRADYEARWAGQWSATEIKPREPREMAQWLRARQSICERADAVARRARAVEAETKARNRHLRALRETLTGVGGAAPPDATLRQLLALAKARADKAHAACSEHDELTRELRAARRMASEQRQKADEYRKALGDWQGDWAQLIVANGWPEEVDADSARQVLAAVDELSKQLHDMAQLDGRVRGIEERLTAFARDTGQLTADVAPDLASWPSADAVAELARRLDRAVQIRSTRETLVGELDAAHKKQAAAERAVEHAESDVIALVQLAGVSSVDELPDAERRSARAAELRAQLPELERQITEAGRAPLRQLIQHASRVNIDALDAQAVEADDALAQLEDALQQLDVRLGELGAEQQKMESVDGAASAAELVEQRVAELRDLTARYLQLYVAAWALSEAIDAYRRDHKDPLLRRADELFPKLTCGRFAGLEVSFDEADEPVLVGVRLSGERVPVKVMSSGTREQLYLALRLASLERHVALHGPMPIILDDVVLHSDPNANRRS